MIAAAGKQPKLGFASETAIMLPQFLIQRGAERNLAVLAAFAFANMNAHHRLIDVGQLQVGDFSASCARAVRGHEQRAMERGVCSVDEAGDFFDAQDQRQAVFSFRIRRVFHAPRFTKDFDVKETQSRDLLRHAAAAQLTDLE
jgi:hypothetical protein